MNIVIAKYDSTDDFTEESWDIYHSGDFYFQYDFLRVIEKARVNDTELRFLTFSHNNQPIGAAVLSYFWFHIDLLTNNKFVKYLKKLFPNLLKFPVTCCGVPVSFGQNHFFVREEKYYEDILQSVQKELENFALQMKCKIIAWKEFEFQAQTINFFKQYGFIQCRSIPNTYVSVKSTGIDSLLNNLRSPYKRKMKKTLVNYYNHHCESSFKISIENFSINHINEFYIGYLSVLQRTTVKLEIYPQIFFTYLAEAYKDKIKILTISNKSETISALLLPDCFALNFLLVSKEKKHYSNGLYASLIRAIVIYGLENGFTKIKMGQTSYYAKMCAGAKIQPLYFYLRSDKKWMNSILLKFNNLLFPEIAVPKVNALN